MRLKKQMRKYGKQVKKGMAVAALSIAAATVAGGSSVSPVWMVEAETEEEVGSVTQDGIKYVLYSDNTCEVDGVETSVEGNVILPDTVTWNGTSYKVTEIGFAAFAECNGLTSIEIPDGVTIIEDGAFGKCSSLASIKLPSGVTSIGSYAFYGCSSLTSIELPDSVTSIGESAFDGCSSLTSIELPDSVTSIGESAFYGCSSLASIKIPAGIDSLYWLDPEYVLERYEVSEDNPNYSTDENGLLYDKKTENLIRVPCKKEEVVIPGSVKNICEYAFYCCDKLTSIELPAGVTSIGAGAFYGCSSLTNIELPAGVTSIGYCLFDGCSSLTSIKLPSGVTSIGSYAFSGCTNLSEIIIPEGVKEIASNSFDRCANLKQIVLPSSLRKIDWIEDYDKDTDETVPMFVGTNDNLTVYMYGKLSDDWQAEIFYDGEVYFEGEVAKHVKIVNILEQGVTDKQGVRYEFTYDEDSEVVAANIIGFTKTCKSKITIPSKVEKYGRAFNVTHIDFKGSSRITDLTISDGVKSLDFDTILSCQNLSTVSIPKSLTKIENLTGVGKNKKLKKVKIDSANKVYSADNKGLIYNKSKSILYCALPGVTSIKISNKTKKIAMNAFYPCKKIKKITIPNNVTKIEGGAFRQCTNLQSVTLSKNIKVLDPNTFSYCNKLKSVKLPDKLVKIYGGTFYDCKSLKSLTFPKSFKSFVYFDGLCPFVNCNNLKTITFKGPVSKGIDQYIFNGCNKNVVVKVPASHYNKFKKIYKGKATVKKL